MKNNPIRILINEKDANKRLDVVLAEKLREYTRSNLKKIIKSIEETGKKYGEDISLGLDCASSELYKDKTYCLDGEGAKFSSDEMIDYLIDLVNKYQIISIEDPLDESDWSAWKKFSEKTNNLQIVGDDIFVTNKKLLEKGIADIDRVRQKILLFQILL